MATTAVTVETTVALDEVHVAENVRAFDVDHVHALAESIRLQGMLVPVVVRPAEGDAAVGGWKYELVAGFHRTAAATELRLAEIPAVIRAASREAAADRAIENITRLQLSATEEAHAVMAMLDRGLTGDGAAKVLGWPRARVTARVKILELPERAQEMIGAGVIALSAVDQLRAIGRVSPALLDAVVGFLGDGNEWAAERLVREPGWVLESALRAGEVEVFAAHMSQVGSGEIAELRLGKKTEALYVEAEKLHKRIDRSAYGPPTIRFSDDDIDQARAAGVVIEFERGAPIIVDRALYRELVKRSGQAQRRATARERGAAGGTAQAGSPYRGRHGGRPGGGGWPPARPPVAGAGRPGARGEPRSRAGLLNGLSMVDPASLDVAKFFVLCGRPHSVNYAERSLMRSRAPLCLWGRPLLCLASA
jgi:ParB/RepB/Spo0J family partition protein